MAELIDAIRERRLRAIEVRETYTIEPVGAQGYVVIHPDEERRCYFVDMLTRRCNCPDWCCTAQGLSIDCKHIVAVDPIWRRETNRAPLYFVHRGKPTHESGQGPGIIDPTRDERGRRINPFTGEPEEEITVAPVTDAPDPFAIL